MLQCSLKVLTEMEWDAMQLNKLLSGALTACTLFLGCERVASAQEAAPVPIEVPSTSAIVFDKPIPFETIEELSAIYDETGTLHLYPISLKVPPSTVKLTYVDAGRDGSAAILSFTVVPILSLKRTNDELIQFIKTVYPEVKFQVGRVKQSHFTVSILGQSTSITPYSASSQISEEFNVAFPISELATSFLLNESTTDIPIGGVRLVYAVTGKQITASQVEEVVTRRFSVGNVVQGGCGRYAVNYANAVKGTVGCTVLRKLTTDEVRQIQRKLKNIKLYDGPVDGIVGPKTRAATLGYQVENKLPQTGVLDFLTREKLFGEEEV